MGGRSTFAARIPKESVLMADMEIRKQKKILRTQIQEEILLLPEDYRRKADREIVRLLLTLPEYHHADTVFCFAGTASEINTDPFLAQVLADGKVLSVPLCTGKGIMEARRIRSLEELRDGKYGLREPSRSTELIAPEKIDLAVIPCLSCTHSGTRLGHGGGYYDRYFSPAPKFAAVIICYEKLVRDSIPSERHDVRFPLVITEAGIYPDE